MRHFTILPDLQNTNGVLQSLIRSLHIWERSRDVFLRNWKTETGGIVVEPLLVLTAVGFGLGSYMADVQGKPYAEFVAPGLLASYAMFGATFETTFGTYLRMETRRTFSSILATPVSVSELITGEVLWAGTRSLMHAGVLLLVAWIFGLIHSPYALLVIPSAILIGLMFGSIAILATSLAPSISALTNFFTLFITPMFFFSGIFYPLDRLPEGIQAIAWLLPLTPAAYLTRSMATGEVSWLTLMSVVIIVALTAIFLPLGIRGMRRRLVK